MAQQYIDTGSVPNSVGGESLRSAFDKINDNFAELDDILNPNVSYHTEYIPIRITSLPSAGNWALLYQKTAGTVTPFQLIWGSGSANAMFLPTSGSLTNVTVTTEKADSNEWDIGVLVGPPSYFADGNISDTTNWALSSSFTPDVTSSFEYTLSSSFNPGDFLGIAIKRSAGSTFNNFQVEYTLKCEFD